MFASSETISVQDQHMLLVCSSQILPGCVELEMNFYRDKCSLKGCQYVTANIAKYNLMFLPLKIHK